MITGCANTLWILPCFLKEQQEFVVIFIIRRRTKQSTEKNKTTSRVLNSGRKIPDPDKKQGIRGISAFSEIFYYFFPNKF
jgi:hypothetical protein